MKIVWDEHKRLTNLARHGLDFADLDTDFFATARSVSADQGRFVAGIVVAVVFRPLGAEAISVISMRPAGRKERRR